MPLPEPSSIKNTLMATVQIMAFLTMDGYLARKAVLPEFWLHPEEYGISDIRKSALSCLTPDTSFITLSRWKQEHAGKYLVEAAAETLPFIDSLLHFRMADELLLYILPGLQGDGSPLFDGHPDPFLWELTGMRRFDKGVCRLQYKRNVVG